MEPWSIVANHPLSGDPFGLVVEDNSTFAEAEHIARSLLGSFKLTGGFLPSSADNPTHGQYLFLYYVHPDTHCRLATIWAHNIDDALLRLNILAADGILLMPTGG